MLSSLCKHTCIGFDSRRDICCAFLNYVFFRASLLHLLLHYNADYTCFWGEREKNVLLFVMFKALRINSLGRTRAYMRFLLTINAFTRTPLLNTGTPS